MATFNGINLTDYCIDVKAGNIDSYNRKRYNIQGGESSIYISIIKAVVKTNTTLEISFEFDGGFGPANWTSFLEIDLKKYS